MIIAMAIGTLPVLAIGATAYYFADQSITKEIAAAQQRSVADLQDKVNRFMQDRFGDIQMMATLDLLTDPKLRQLVSRAELEAALGRIAGSYGLYESIAVFDLRGEPIAQTPGKKLENHLNRVYIQAAIKANGPVLSQPLISTSEGTFSVYSAAVIKDQVTGQPVGYIRARMPVRFLEETIKNYGRRGTEYYLINSSGEVFLAPEGIYVTKVLSTGKAVTEGELEYQSVGAEKFFPKLPQLKELGILETQNTSTNRKQLVAYAPPTSLEGLPALNWSAIMATDTAILFAPQRQLLLTLAIGTGVTALLVGAMAALLAERATRPIQEAAKAVAKIGQGELDTRLKLGGEDEIGILGANINKMIEQLEALLQAQTLSAQQAGLLKDITLKISEALDSETVFDTAVQEIRQALKSDRVIVFRLDETSTGTIVAESGGGGWPRAIGAQIADPCLAGDYVDKYKQGRVQATADIYQAGLRECHLKQLEPFGVKANLVAPILVGGELLGLLIAHECHGPRNWEKSEIDFFAQLATQVGLALERVELLERQRISEEEQRRAKEDLQRRALELLTEVDPVSKGDLTIRARVTGDEIGTLADSYNATIESLRKIVTQVQKTTQQVAVTTNTNEALVQTLSGEALRQAEEIAVALERIQAMNDSARTVAANAKQAEAAVRQATQTVEAGDAAMNRTVEGIDSIRATVGETAEKVRRLGESSQKISKVVSLIGKFAAQTHLLALKASIEAARAGEGGQGFAVIADEVRSLASQSAAATGEIENLVASIQSETKELAAAMAAGTEQVAVGTNLVGETRQSLNQMAAVSAQLNQLVEAIAQAAAEQSEASQTVTQTMAEVAAIANRTSTSATNVSASFRELLTVSQDLQKSVGQFKVH
jgi:methyl-accepting chemotaxis protein